MPTAKTFLTDEIRELLEAGDTVSLKSALEEMHPASVAEYLSELDPEQIVRVLAVLRIQFRADVFSNFPIDLQVELVEGSGRRPMARLLEEMEPDDRADLVQALPEGTQEELLPLLAHAERADLRRLASYPEDSAGAVMTTEYATLPEDISVGDALSRLRTVAPDAETIYYVYVVDRERRLKGVVSLKTLILARRDRLVADVMTPDVVAVRVDDDKETVAREIEKYDWLAIPVVDYEQRLVGIVTVDDVLDVIEAEVDEDIYAFGAAGKPIGYFSANPARMAGQRLPWLLVLVFVGFVSATLLGRYEESLTAWGLFIFVPMVLGSGGNAGSQTVAVIVRGLATEEFGAGDFFRIWRKELAVALLVGVSLGIVAGVLVILLTGGWGQAMVVALAIMSALVIAKTLGSLLPMIFQRIGLDPALMSAPLITTMLDVVAVAVYLGLATIIMGAVQ